MKGVIDIVRTDNAVAVTADHFWAARQGVDALKISWDASEKKPLSNDAMWADLRDASARGKPVMGREEGDPDGRMASVAKGVDAVYELPFLVHATMGPINTTVHVRPDTCEIWLGTQAPTAVQSTAAKLSGLPPDKVILHNHLVGGGFGRRLVAYSVERAVAIAKQVPYPVRIIWTREQDIRHDLYRPVYYDLISAGLDQNGMPVAWTDRVTGGSVLGSYLPGGLPEGVLDSDAIEGAAQPHYALPSIRVDWIRRDPPVKVNWWLGVGISLHGFPRQFPGDRGRGCRQPRRPGPAQPHRRSGGCQHVRQPGQLRGADRGGMVFRLSAALYNGITFQDGTVDQSNFHDYRQMRTNKVPPFEVHWIESSEAPDGIGESGTVSAAPALGNGGAGAYAGGLAFTLPFGTIYSSNITPNK